MNILPDDGTLNGQSWRGEVPLRATLRGGREKGSQLWAICPFIPIPDQPLITGPVVFDSRAKAEAFLNGASVLVYDGWGRGEEKNFESREKWLRAIASVWVWPLRDDPRAKLAGQGDAADREQQVVGVHASATPEELTRDVPVGDGFSRAEIEASMREQHEQMSVWIEICPVGKRALETPARSGYDVYVCPLAKHIRRSRGDLIALPMPVHRLGTDCGPPCSRRLSEFRPEELNPVPVSETGQVLEMCWSALGDPWMYCLHRDWGFHRIKREADSHKWHRAPKYNLKIDNLRQHFWRIVLEIEESLFNHHPNLSATALRAFWTSWQIFRHLDGIRRQVEKYADLPGAVAGSIAGAGSSDVWEATMLVEQNVRSFLNEAITGPIPRHISGIRSNFDEVSEHRLAKPRLVGQGVRKADRSMPVNESEKTETELRRSARVRMKPGPRRDRELGFEVLAIVNRVADPHSWKSKLEEICKALDEAKVSCPKTWPQRDSRMRDWTEGFLQEPDLVKKAIDYRLKNARQ